MKYTHLNIALGVVVYLLLKPLISTKTGLAV